jgi:hypothetical protein
MIENMPKIITIVIIITMQENMSKFGQWILILRCTKMMQKKTLMYGNNTMEATQTIPDET